MCTVVVAQEILDSLSARIENKSVFSAYDITKDARLKTTDRIDHSDVRRIVHEEYETGQFPDGYDRDAINLDIPINPNVIVYYPDGKSAADHPKAIQPAPTAPVSQAPASVAQATSTSDLGGSKKDGSGYICEPTAKGVINIPKAIVDKVTPNGGTYDISISGTVVFKQPDGHGRLRISSSKLGGGSKFRLEVDTDKNLITVEQV